MGFQTHMGGSPWPGRRAWALLFALALFLGLPVLPALAQAGPDFPLAGGHFYSEANGQGGGPGQPGFAITNDGAIPFWSTFSGDGGVAALGYPISARFVAASSTDQALQKAILQWNGGVVSLLNVLDVLHNDGRDPLLQSRYLTPPPADTGPDAGLTWSQIVARHQQFLAANPALQAAYFAVADPITIYGLPMSVPTAEANGSVVVVRLQRAVLQLWLTAQPWAAAGQVTVANAGDIAKTAGILPAAALTPQAAPAPSASLPYAVSATTSDNWSGYVAATDLNSGQPGTVSDVKASWVVPTVNCSGAAGAEVGIWIGIDGVFSPTVEQTGTGIDCGSGGATYYAWLQTYPAAARTAALAIQPGDTIAAEVQALGHNEYQITLNDVTSGQGFSVQRSSPGSRDSAEWVVEAPAQGDHFAPLADFGSVQMNGSSVTINGQTGGINSAAWAAAPIGMIDQAGHPRAIPATLTPDGAGFTVTWQQP